MDLSLKYSKTSKGARAVLMKSRVLPSQFMLVLSNIDGKTTAEDIQAKLQLTEEKFTQALTQLPDEAYIQVVQDFGPSVFDLNSAIQVSEISPEEFLNLELPEESTGQRQEQIEAEARAKAYAEEQARKEAQAREQEEAERKLLLVTDILAKSADKIDIEKLASGEPISSPKKISSREGKDRSRRDQDAARTESPANTPPIGVEETAGAQDTLDFSQPLSQISVQLAQERAEAEAKAREEDARRLAEEKARLEEAKAQEDAERKAREKAELEAVARREAEARAEAERRKQESEEKARLKAEEKARQEEERRLRKEAERARKLAEEKAREEARVQAKEESERKAREAAERRAREKAEAEARARVEAERRAKEKAELQAKKAAEAEVRAEAQRKVREEAQIRKEALAIQRSEAREEARRLAQEKSAQRAAQWADKRVKLEAVGSLWLERALTMGRPLLIGIAVSLVLLILLLQFINLSMLAPSIEKSISASIGEPIKVMNVRLSVWPRPHVVLEGLTVGELSDIKARSAEVYIRLLSLPRENIEADSVAIEGLEIPPEALRRPVKWANAARVKKLQLQEISLKNVLIKLPVPEFPTFDANIRLDDRGSLKTARLSAKNISAELTPVRDVMNVSIEAHGWQSPLGPGITFDELSAEGIADSEKLVLKKVEGNVYDGALKATASVHWNNAWSTEGNFELAHVHLDQAMPAISDAATLQGKLDARGEFTASSDSPTKLLESMTITSRFEAQNGEIGGLDLARAASGRQQVGGATRYDTVSGGWLLKDQHYQLSQLELKAGSLQAQGEVEISPNQDVSGRVMTLLNLNSRQLQGKFSLSGKLGNVRISR